MSTYRDCAFDGCNRTTAKDFDFPLCPKHCRIVYLNVKDLLDDANLAAKTQSANAGGRPRVLASKAVGVVYFARIGDLIKIGYTTNLRQRMSDLGAKVLATMPGTMATEKAVHAKFGPLWERGELFRPGQELLDYIARHAESEPSTIALDTFDVSSDCAHVPTGDCNSDRVQA